MFYYTNVRNKFWNFDGLCIGCLGANDATYEVYACLGDWLRYVLSFFNQCTKIDHKLTYYCFLWKLWVPCHRTHSWLNDPIRGKLHFLYILTNNWSVINKQIYCMSQCRSNHRNAKKQNRGPSHVTTSQQCVFKSSS